jgi:SAM-dependent methyltransferase
MAFFRAQLGMRPEHVVVDVGSGTGFLAEAFLEAGNRVYGVEPNREMRAAGERWLAGHGKFTSVDGLAEATTLPDQAADFVIAGQAFHWFEPVATKREFQRLLRPGGWVALVWNDRRCDTTPFLRAYEELLRHYCAEHSTVAYRANHATDAEVLRAFFAPEPYRREIVARHGQDFDLEGLQGRLLSSSYAPRPGQPNHEAMIEALGRLFAEHQRDGRVSFEYDTEVFFGHLAPLPT